MADPRPPLAELLRRLPPLKHGVLATTQGPVVQLKCALWTATGRRYIAGETMTVLGEFNGKLDLDGPHGRLFRVPQDAVEFLETEPVSAPRRRIPIGSLELP